ncbi:hypothetical protein [uncultured Maribacter sp.]|uniref:hypothetical protein n=1 Tax=uncultured Maribacter sp. TaxID=431308 RepID=UPI0026156DE6|nr:hypothetical protein [uncultured Maribacter sp.]
MKLSQSQIQDIERYLDYHELKQVDLRVEVLDHMAESIEAAMENGVSYTDAFNQQKEKWDPELKSYSSFWLGWTLVGPKLLMKKCLQIEKEIHFKALPVAIIITASLYFFLNFIDAKLFLGRVNLILGVVFSISIVLFLVVFSKIKKSKIESTYGYLYKIHIKGFGFSGIWITFFFMALIDDIKQINTITTILQLFGIAMYFIVNYMFYKVYKKHIAITTQKLL